MSGTRIKTKRSPMKALPISSTNLFPINYFSITPTFSTPTRHISPEHGTQIMYKGKVINQSENCIRRTASLDALTVINYSLTQIPSTFLHLDKATQTEESCLSDRTLGKYLNDTCDAESPSDKTEKFLKHRYQPRYNFRTSEHSVSSQTLSPVHVKASPVLIPSRPNQPMHMRPMRSSVEGLNQEIEKLVLHPSGQLHSCRQELELYSRGTPEGHRAPINDLFYPVGEYTRSTQTPSADMMSSDSQSTSPDDGVQSKDASPRINRFLAREPPDGCEKVNLNLRQTECSSPALFKPIGFQLRPSLGSAFQPIPIIPKVKSTSDIKEVDTKSETKAEGDNKHEVTETQ